jgi:hypothetical protein
MTDPALQKVTLWLTRDSVARMETLHGWGWSREVRKLVDNYVSRYQPKQTIGDLDANRD